MYCLTEEDENFGRSGIAPVRKASPSARLAGSPSCSGLFLSLLEERKLRWGGARRSEEAALRS